MDNKCPRCVSWRIVQKPSSSLDRTAGARSGTPTGSRKGFTAEFNLPFMLVPPGDPEPAPEYDGADNDAEPPAGGTVSELRRHRAQRSNRSATHARW